MRRSAIVLAVVVLVLSFSLTSVCLAQAPAGIPVPAAVKADPIPMTAQTQVYNLPAGTAYKDVLAAYDAEMTKAGWKTETAAPDCATGINAAAYTKDTQGFIVFFMPADKPTGQPGLMTVLLGPPAADAAAPAAGTTPDVPPAAPAAGDLPGCCKAAAAGNGLVWFENHIGQEVVVDMFGKQIKVPAKQGDVAGCACAEGKPGKYQVIAKLPSGTENLTMDVQVIEGQVAHVPFALQP